jgi:hypothetical protein
MTPFSFEIQPYILRESTTIMALDVRMSAECAQPRTKLPSKHIALFRYVNVSLELSTKSNGCYLRPGMLSVHY